jgi:hypothetical protein
LLASMRPCIIADDMDGLDGRGNLRVQVFQEGNELTLPFARMALAVDLPGPGVERGEQIQRPGPSIFVLHTIWDSGLAGRVASAAGRSSHPRKAHVRRVAGAACTGPRWPPHAHRTPCPARWSVKATGGDAKASADSTPGYGGQSHASLRHPLMAERGMRHLYIGHEWIVADPRPQERLLRALRIILEHPEDAMPVSLYVRVATRHRPQEGIIASQVRSLPHLSA